MGERERERYRGQPLLAKWEGKNPVERKIYTHTHVDADTYVSHTGIVLVPDINRTGFFNIGSHSSFQRSSWKVKRKRKLISWRSTTAGARSLVGCRASTHSR